MDGSWAQNSLLGSRWRLPSQAPVAEFAASALVVAGPRRDFPVAQLEEELGTRLVGNLGVFSLPFPADMVEHKFHGIMTEPRFGALQKSVYAYHPFVPFRVRSKLRWNC